MSISAAHSAAARQNGKLSHGPVTDEGKANSSRNACKHGLFGDTRFLSEEHRAKFARLEAVLLLEYRPCTPTEFHYVHELADARVRLDIVRDHTIALLQNKREELARTSPDCIDLDAEAFHQLAQSSTLALLERYERHFERRIDKSVAMLRKIELERPARAAGDYFLHQLATEESPTEPLPEYVPVPSCDPETSHLQNDPNPSANDELKAALSRPGLTWKQFVAMFPYPKTSFGRVAGS